MDPPIGQYRVLLASRSSNPLLLFLIVLAGMETIKCQSFTWRNSYSRGVSSLSYCVSPTPIKELN